MPVYLLSYVCLHVSYSIDRKIEVSTHYDSSADCFFFFQAEDGIRDLTVTGVQTCALPICCRRHTTVLWGRIPAGISRRSFHTAHGGPAGHFAGRVATAGPGGHTGIAQKQIGRASCRERV